MRMACCRVGSCLYNFLSLGRSCLVVNRMPCKNFSLYLFKHQSSQLQLSSQCCYFSTSSMCMYKKSVQSLKEENPVTMKQVQKSQPVSELVTEILHFASKTHKMVGSVDQGRVRVLIQKLISFGFSEKELLKLFIERPGLLLQHKLVSTTEFLFSYGFSATQILSMFSIMESMPDVRPSKMEKFLENLRKIGFEDKNILAVVSSHPHIMLLNSDKILTRVISLKELFKSKDVITLIEKSPSILFDEWDIIQVKFNYVHHVMGVSQRQMMYSEMFSYPVEHIQCRHVFLVRAGFFTKQRRKEGEININPQLQTIIDTADDVFARKHGGMTAHDYQVFSKLFEKEKKMSIEEMIELEGS